MNINFKDKTIIITGGTRGIGKQIAEDLFNLEANIIITGTGHNLNNSLFSNNFNRVKYFQVDFTKNDELNSFVEFISDLDSIYGLVNNAGINVLDSISAGSNIIPHQR